MLRALLALLLSWQPVIDLVPPVPPELASIFAKPPEMRLQGIADGADGLTVCGDKLFFSDMGSGRSVAVASDGAVRVVRPDAAYAGTVGRACGAVEAVWGAARELHKLYRIQSEFASQFDGDSRHSSHGPAHIAVLVAPGNVTEHVFWTEPVHHAGDKTASDGKGAIYELTMSLSADGKLPRSRLVNDALPGATGLTFSPDAQLLYVGDVHTGRVHAFKLADLSASPTLVADLADKGGVGLHALATDMTGRIYGATPRGVAVLAPDGRWLGLLTTPEPAIDLAWGGPDRRTLWILTATGLFRTTASTAGAFPR